jgi:glutamate-1-semialdehyde 2,1-aminomutase
MTMQAHKSPHVAESVDEEYARVNPRSHELFVDQCEVVPGGYTHRARVLLPFPIFVDRNVGAYKWDVDSHRYIDYWLGHGAMLLGHAHPTVVEAVRRQAEGGFHAGGETPLGLAWAKLIQQLVPSAEAVRFTASGGEATQLAIRVARAHSGKSKILTFRGGFHGWHDAVTIGAMPPWHVPASAGVPAAIAETVVSVPFLQIEAVERALESDRDIAAIMLEPGGLSDDTVPSTAEFLRDLRALSAAHGVVLVFDEVVTGFRYARGGVQAAFGVTPDLTALGKVIGGGVPCGALVGNRNVMDVLAWKPDKEWQRHKMVPHPGTWNAAPLAAAAGVATLQLVRDTDAVERAITLTQRLIEGLNAAFEAAGVEAFAYGRGSIFKTCLGARPALLVGDCTAVQSDITQLLGSWGDRGPSVRKAMLLEGVDLMRQDGFVAAVHTDQDIDTTSAAMERALSRLKREGLLQ